MSEKLGAGTISIAMCTFNGARFIEQQLRSIAEQSRLPDELIVCDDGSSDDTVGVVRSFARTAPFPVRVFENERRLGSTKNFEKAIMLCGGSLIALADQDDVWHQEKLAVQERFLQTEPVAGVFADGEVVGRDLAPTGYRIWEAIGFSPREQARLRSGDGVGVLVGREVVAGCTLLFRSECRETFLPIPDGWFHDGWISLVLAAVGGIGLVERPLLRYRQHGGNQLGTPEPGMRAKWRRTRRFTVDRVLGDLERCESGYEQLRGSFPPGSATELRTEFEAKIAHLQMRAHLPSRRLDRVPVILRELRSGRYGRYSRGWRGVLKDFLRK
jgi:glycosyltransferase involved in cell wall biosynthesis